MKIKLQRFRIAMNMSQKQLADMIGVSRVYINKIESGKDVPSWMILLKLAEALKICPYELLDFCSDCHYYICCKGKFFLPTQ